eukprot:scaffold48_cov311-Pinguiococcus_pyrenoidosus.AAC.290
MSRLPDLFSLITRARAAQMICTSFCRRRALRRRWPLGETCRICMSLGRRAESRAKRSRGERMKTVKGQLVMPQSDSTHVITRPGSSAQRRKKQVDKRDQV